MRHFPIFLNLSGRRVIVSGAGECAVAKLRLLLKTEARISVFGTEPAEQVRDWAADGRLTLIERPLEEGDAVCAALVYGANEDAALDARAVAIGRRAGALTNIVDNLEDSQFITPAIVDRDPVTVAIGTEGAAPVLARRIKADLEERLPASLGILARIGQSFRPQAEALRHGLPRRRFWSRFYFERGPEAVKSGDAAVRNALETLLAEELDAGPETGHVWLVGTGPGDPELMTLKARRLLHEADVVIHDRLVPQPILELARREATVIEVGKTPYGRSWSQDDINALIVEHGRGSKVVRLKSGDPGIFGRLDEEMDALDAAGIPFEVVPGVTSASAAAASIKTSLTRRGRNGSLRILTGHDVKGFADHDWRALARPGTVAAIYMGVRASTFIRGRLMIAGCPEDTPVTAVENASRPDQRVIATRLIDLPQALDEAAPHGPVMLFLGLSPRAAELSARQLRPQAEAL
ncbi:uroporphyrinogen-III C-methyltransferase [Halovulum dunhuangense]|uniref:Uroporphyrinogen-III C-methyltransferase n=1 Tax=Halovulum dunhuangense TaxID=1505036 RepID=A0A849KV17_9RHOB|nr:siroheme synthase CysG [Halovulum dunhuangense]NNU79198.1 uroporphyrinogen-III C-methyltransferase [Halovulum dunhuangense]